MRMAGNDDLHPLLSKLHETLGEVLETLQNMKGELTKVHTAVTEGTETLHEAISDNTRARAELKVIEQISEVKSVEPRIDAKRARVEREWDDLDDRLERIKDRFERRHAELDRKAANRVRNLGSHIFEIEEEQFEDGIETPFADHVTTVWTSLQNHNVEVSDERGERIGATTAETTEQIGAFLDQQRELLTRLRDVRTDLTHSPSGSTRLQLPYYVVTVEVGDATEQSVVVPSRLDEDAGPPGVGLEPLPGLEDLVSSTELAGTRTTTVSGDELWQSIEPQIRDDRLLISTRSTVESGFAESIDVAIETGE